MILIYGIVVFVSVITGLGDRVQLGAESAIINGEVRVVATAINRTGETIEFCGHWSAGIEYEPNDETRLWIARREAEIEAEIALAESEGRNYYSRCWKPRAPRYYSVSGHVCNNDYSRFLHRLEPGASLSDTVSFNLTPDSYAKRPGWIRVRFRLDICDESDEEATTVPDNGLGGEVSCSIPVPWGS